ncbi:MAG TPA: class I SAM-dependent methyltransferase [Acidimicrobiales bacterium]|nr:class I SAM-dependent methyltransferase [Acidimicrobiales bacterium]
MADHGRRLAACAMPSTVWGRDVAETYDAASAAMFEPDLLVPTVDLLFELARGGPALELAVGTGRVALPLAGRGITVSGIELSPHMARQLRAKPGGQDLAVTIGDMTTARVAGDFKLVYLVWNAIMNLTTQDEQVAVFANAAAHLEPGGCFVVEVGVPKPPVEGEVARVFTMEEGRVGIDTYDDLVGQILSSHHWVTLEGRFVRFSAPYRYVWPAELDLMARVAGMRLKHRWAGWRREPFTSASTNQVAVFEKPAA